MILLSGQSLTPARKLMPEALGLSLEERRSTATLQLGPEDPEIPVGSWMLDDEPGTGEGIVWRTRSADNNFNTETRSITLEHIISTLQDDVLFGEHTWEDIAGAGASDCSAQQAAEYILARQSLWVLGDFEFTERWPYKFNGDSLFSALQTVTASCPDACWEYDLSQIPFRLHVRRISDETTCEMRPGRNIRTIKRVIDRSGMYTRHYPIGKDDLHITGDYISKNEAIYGKVCKIETYSGAETEDALRSWAWERLNRHCEPKVTVTIGGLELSEATGENLDRLTLNRRCRVPLPEFGTTITERIIRIRVTDKVRKKEEVTVTLGNEIPDLAAIVGEVEKEQASGRGGGGRGGMKQAGEDHAWFVDTDTHVGMVAEAIIGHGPDGVDWSRVAEVIVDGNGIHNRVTRAEGYMVVLEAKIDLTEETLRAEFTNATASLRSELEMSAASLRVEFENLNNSTRSELQITSESLRTEFTNLNNSTRSELQITSESLRNTITNTAEGLHSEISQQAGRISLVVEGTGSNARIKPAAIVASINNGASTIKLSADHIDIDGIVDSLDSYSVTVGMLEVEGQAQFEGAAYFYSGLEADTIHVENIDVDGNDISNPITGADVTGNVLTLTYADGTTAATFSKATTLSGEWSGTASSGKSYKATASPQNVTHYSPALDPSGWSKSGNPSWAADYKSFTQSILVSDVNGEGIVLLSDVPFSTTDSYNAGNTSGYNAAKADYSMSAGGVLTVSKTRNGSTTFPISFAIDSAISYDSATHKYTAKALCDDTLMDSTESGTEAYDAGVTAGEGHFSLAPVTLQGSGEYITPINSGSQIKVVIGTRYTAGSGYTWYRSGESKTYHDVGDHTVYSRSNLKRLKYVGSISGQSGYYYKLDSSGTANYETTEFSTTTRNVTLRGSQVSGTNQGDPESVYVPNSGGTSYYQAGSSIYRYNAGSTVSNTYYTKNS
jgi:hypothetical protein